MNDDKDIAPEEGAAFLKTLDDALAGRATEGPHAELAQFGAGVARAPPPWRVRRARRRRRDATRRVPLYPPYGIRSHPWNPSHPRREA